MARKKGKRENKWKLLILVSASLNVFNAHVDVR